MLQSSVMAYIKGEKPTVVKLESFQGGIVGPVEGSKLCFVNS